MTTTARRLLLPPGEVAELCHRIGLVLPPTFAAERAPLHTAGLLRDGAVHPSLATGLAATCSPQLGVLVTSSIGEVAAALGVRGDLGGSLLRAGPSPVEVAAWPAEQLGPELARVVPPLPSGPRPDLHLPVSDLATSQILRRLVVGTLHATVVTPDGVIAQLPWLGTAQGWVAVAPAEVREGVRWVQVRPVEADDLSSCLAPWIAEALA